MSIKTKGNNFQLNIRWLIFLRYPEIDRNVIDFHVFWMICVKISLKEKDSQE